MDDALRKKLRELPPLGKALGMTANCKVCGRPSNLFDIVDFNKHCSPNSVPVRFLGDTGTLFSMFVLPMLIYYIY